jgi:hypothetical protein
MPEVLAAVQLPLLQLIGMLVAGCETLGSLWVSCDTIISLRHLCCLTGICCDGSSLAAESVYVYIIDCRISCCSLAYKSWLSDPGFLHT